MIPVPDISQTYPKTSLTLDSRFVVGEGNARDLSSDANTGTIVSGRALSLDGTGDHLDGGSIAAHAFTGSFTVSLWAKSSSATEQTFAMKFSGGSTGYQITLRADQNPAYWICSVADDSGWQHGRIYETQLSTTWDDGTWRHICLRANNGTLEGYVNGTIGSDTDTYNNSVALGTSGQRMTIGGNYSGTPSNLVTGSMCGLKIFNVALSAAQIAEQYSNPEQVLPTGVSAANLISYWPLHDYDNTSPNSLDGLYFMDLGTAKSNAKASNCGMDRKEGVPCPQLGLMPSTSRVLLGGASSGDYLQSSDTSLSTAAFSFSAWVCAFSSAGSYPSVISAHDGSSDDYSNGITIDFGSGSQTAVEYINIEGVGVSSAADVYSGSIPFGQWFHIVVTSTTGEYKLYINGSDTNCSTRSRSATTANDLNIVRIGARYYSSAVQAATQFDGIITDVGLWNATLDSDSVAAIYAAGIGADIRSDISNYDQSSALQHFWKTNNAYTVQDLKGSDDLTVNGSPSLVVIPEGATAGTTVFGSTEEKRAGNAVINLDGHSYVTIPHDVNLNPDLSEGFTCSAWFKMRNLGSGSSTPIFDKDGGNDRWYLRIRDDASDVYQFNFGDGSGTTDIGGGTLSDNNWHHVAVTLDYGEDEGIFYVDGSAVGSATDISARTADCPGTDALTIGSDGTTAVLNGAVAYPKIYARVLTANEIKLLYSSGHRVAGGL